MLRPCRFSPSQLLVCLFFAMVALLMLVTNYAMKRGIREEITLTRHIQIVKRVNNSLGATRKASPSNEGSKTDKGDYVFRNQRLRLWYGGRCIDSRDGQQLSVQFCDPNIEQAFSLTTDNRLIYEKTGGCVSYETKETAVFLNLVDCSHVTGSFFTQDKNGQFYLQHVLKNEEWCVTPISKINSNVTKIPCLSDPIGLTVCDKEASRILPIEEEIFKNDRKLMKGAVIAPNSSCDFRACELNKREPVNLLPLHQANGCTQLWECVTVAVKTARRPHLVVRLAQSVRDSLGFDIPIVAYDDGPNDYSEEVLQQMAEYPLLRYIVSSDEDLGISRGRNLAVLQVKTKYFFLADDDIKFNKDTKLDKLVAILDTTDATVASATYSGSTDFTGYFQFGYFNSNDKSKPRLGFYHHACTLVNQTIPGHPDCVRCEVSSNVFLARTKEILDIGGWDPELMTIEHKDIFIRLKAAGMKVALCPDAKVKHARPGKVAMKGVGYNEKRRRGGERSRLLEANRWNIHGIFETGAKGKLSLNSTSGEIKFKEVKVRGYC